MLNIVQAGDLDKKISHCCECKIDVGMNLEKKTEKSEKCSF